MGEGEIGVDRSAEHDTFVENSGVLIQSILFIDDTTGIGSLYTEKHPPGAGLYQVAGFTDSLFDAVTASAKKANRT